MDQDKSLSQYIQCSSTAQAEDMKRSISKEGKR